jgi:hypothetical protein
MPSTVRGAASHGIFAIRNHATPKMSIQQDPEPDEDRAHGASLLWPSPAYRNQIEQLRGAVGERIFIAELRDTETKLGVRITDQAYELLAVADFPRPNPGRGLAPHMIILDDGRGLNLGRIARISRRAFNPETADILYLDQRAEQGLLFRERRLSPTLLAKRCSQSLGLLLGHPADDPRPSLSAPTDADPGVAKPREKARNR